MDDTNSNKRDVAVRTSDIALPSSSSTLSAASSYASAISRSVAEIESLAKAIKAPSTIVEETESLRTEQRPLPSAKPSRRVESEYSTSSTTTYESFSTYIGIDDVEKAKKPTQSQPPTSPLPLAMPHPPAAAPLIESISSTSTVVEDEVFLSTIKREPIEQLPSKAKETDFSLATDQSTTSTLVELPKEQPAEQRPVVSATQEAFKPETGPKIKFRNVQIIDSTTTTSEDELSEGRDASVKFAEGGSGSLLKSSKSRHAKQNMEGGALRMTKSQHVRKIAAEDKDFFEESDESSDSTNLRMGDVFVYMVLPPDGGYGWFITLMSFLCQVVVDGIMFTIGILLPHIARDLDVPGSKVVLVASMQIGFYFLSGTVSSAFINKYGFRPVALTGCIMAISVLSIATFSTNLPMMIFFYSILGGPSLSMIWVSSQLIIGYYFDKFRPIANGISCSGAGAGIMIFSYMNSVLVPILGWRNLMRVHICCLMLVLTMTLTFIEVAPTKIGRIREPLKEEETESETESDIDIELTRYSRYSLKIDVAEYPLDEHFESSLEKPTANKRQSCLAYHQCCEELLVKLCPACHAWLEKRRERKAEEESIRKYVIKQDLYERQDLFYSGPKDRQQEDDYVDQVIRKRTSQRPSLRLSDDDIRKISLEDLDNTYRKRSVINTLSTMQMKKADDSKAVRKSYGELRKTKKCPLLAYLSPQNLLHPKVKKAFRLLFDFRLMAIFEFRILLLSAFLFPMGFNIPFVYSTVRVQIEPAYAKLITPSIGFSNFAFRIASGFIAFKYRAYTTYICGGGMFVGGVAVFTSAFYGLDVVWFQFLYAICYGIAPAFYSTLRAIIYVQCLGLDKLTNAFGLTALAMGMGVFIGTTAGGILNDLTGSYSASFVFAGICICTAGGLKLILPYLIRCDQKEEMKRQQQQQQQQVLKSSDI